MKLQINSLAALERLLDGDDEIEIEVRKSVLESFAKNYLKAIHNNEELAEKIYDLKEELLEAVDDYAKNELGIGNYELSANAKIRIREQVLESVRSFVETAVEEFATDEKIVMFINLHIDKLVKQNLEKYNEQRIAKIIQAVMKKL